MQKARIVKELHQLKVAPPFGIWCKCVQEGGGGDQLHKLQAGIAGPEGSPYAEGLFLLDITLPSRYPFEPPLITFVTPVYHPNIDQGGRICLDLLKMPPRGDWRPTVTLEHVLVSIQTLLACPNPNDPLVMDIAKQYVADRKAYDAAAREATLKHAVQK